MITVNLKMRGADDFINALKRHPEKVGRTINSILVQEARALAVNLGANTLPSRMAEGGAAKLKGRIENDIKRLFPSKDNASKVFEYIKRSDAKLAMAFWAAYKSQDQKAQARIMRRANLPRGIDPVKHQSARKSRGKVPTDAATISFSTDTRLSAYIRKTQKKAGLAKAGWAAAAKALGGRTRTVSRTTGKTVEKFPSYVRALSKRGNIGGASFRGGIRAVAKIWNIVPHIGEALPEDRFFAAIDQAEREFIGALNLSVEHLNKNGFNKSK